MLRRWISASSLIAILSLVLAACEGLVDKPGFRIVGLTDRNELVAFTAEAPGVARVIPLSGVSGKVVGIDYRLDRDLYALGNDGAIYRVDTETGQSKRTATMNQALPSTGPYVVDFDPHFDGLRVISGDGQSFKVNVDTGQVFVERSLAFDAKDRNAGKKPVVSAGAYINAYPGSFATQLFEFDMTTGAYVIQDPPESGRLVTIGPTGLAAGARISAFDIVTDVEYEYHGFAVVGATLYRVHVGRGTLSRIGDIGVDSSRNLIDLAISPKLYPRPPTRPGGGYE